MLEKKKVSKLETNPARHLWSVNLWVAPSREQPFMTDSSTKCLVR